MKEATRLEGPFEFGTKPLQRNCKTDWAEVRKNAVNGDLGKIPDDVYCRLYPSLRAIAKDNAPPVPNSEAVRGLWIYGKSGIGKSWSARYTHGKDRPFF